MVTGPTGQAAPALRMRSAQGRLVLLATVLGTGMAFLDSTVVNIALPSIGEDFDASLSALQWTVNAYTLTLAGLLLLGGALGDRYGRRRIFVAGTVWFTVASLLCAVAPSVEALIAARALQGVGAALLTPGSLAIIEAVFHPDDRGAAIGAWSGLSGTAMAVGPLVGGWFIQAVSWRLIFLVNLPLAAVVVWAAVRHVPETLDEEARGEPIDWAGGALAALGLAGVTYGLTEGPATGWGGPAVVASLVAGVAVLGAFLVREGVARVPMMPLTVFRSRQFAAANAVTFLVYAAIGATLFLIPLQLQVVVGYTPMQAGSALIPLTLVMLLLSARAGRLAQRIGPRIPMTAGPLVVAGGMLLLVRVGPGASYASDILPGVLVYALGLSLTVAPLTATVMSAATPRFAGVASAVNNDVARVAGLVAVALVPAVAGLSGGDYLDPGALDDGFRIGMAVCAALCVAGGLLSLALIRNPRRPVADDPCTGCPIDAPPLRDRPSATAGASR